MIERDILEMALRLTLHDRDKTILEQQARIELLEKVLKDTHQALVDTDNYDEKVIKDTLSTPSDHSALQEHEAKVLEGKWQSIETAPKDGTFVLLYFPHRDLVIRGCWDWQGEGDWESGIQDWQDWCTDDDVVIQEDPSYAPTLWMPLTEPCPDK